jgi:hypothetical protein
MESSDQKFISCNDRRPSPRLLAVRRTRASAVAKRQQTLDAKDWRGEANFLRFLNFRGTGKDTDEHDWQLVIITEQYDAGWSLDAITDPVRE